MECGLIVGNIVANKCGQPEAAGTSAKVVLLNFDDVDRVKTTVSATGTITGIVMKTGKKGVLLTSKDNATIGQATLEHGTYLNTFTHTVDIKAFTRSQEVKNFMNNLSNSRVVAIVENRSIGSKGEVKYEVYGFNSGLICSAMPWTTEYADGVTYQATLSSDDKSKEGQLPLSLFTTDEATTDKAVSALYTA